MLHAFLFCSLRFRIIIIFNNAMLRWLVVAVWLRGGKPRWLAAVVWLLWRFWRWQPPRVEWDEDGNPWVDGLPVNANARMIHIHYPC